MKVAQEVWATTEKPFCMLSNLPSAIAHEQARFWIKVVTRIAFFVYLGWELVRLWRIAGDRERSLVEPILEASARAFVVLILLVLTWVLEWYWMWPLALVTLLGWRSMLTKVVVGYTLTCLPIFYVHHYWSTNMPVELVLAYALPPLVLPVAARVDPARPHDVRAGRALLHEALPDLPRVRAVLGDRGYRALGPAAERHGAHVEIKAQPAGSAGFVPIAMLWRAENAFAQLGRWRRLARCFEGTTASARAWLEVACMGYLFGRLSTSPGHDSPGSSSSSPRTSSRTPPEFSSRTMVPVMVAG